MGSLSFRRLRRRCPLLLSLLLSTQAHAQTVDYNNLEVLFGEPVTLTATGKPQKSSEVPVGMDIITDDQIRRMGVTTLPELLERLPGISSWQSTRNFADVGVRGQNTPYNSSLLVLVNGRQVYSDSNGFTDWSLIPVELEEICQIEVVKGPATALYGFNAVDGVINIITDNPKYDKVNQAGGVTGTGGYKRAYGITTQQLSDDVSLRLSASDENSRDFTKNSKTNFAASSAFQDTNAKKFAADSLVQLDDATQLRLETSYANADGNDALSSYFATETSKSFFSGKSTLTSDTDYGLLEANLYHNTYHNQFFGSASLVPGTLTNDITVAQLQDLFKIGADNTLRLQGEYRENSIESATRLAPGAELGYNVWSGGAMWNWDVTPTVQLTNALRVDTLTLSRDGPLPNPSIYTNNGEFDQNLTAFGVNSGVVWKATDYDTFRAAYGRGVQAPSLIDFASSFTIGPNAYAIGNPYLETSIVDNYELGYDRRIDAIGGKLKSDVFYKRTRDVNGLSVDTVVSNGVVYRIADKIGDTQTAGMELALSGAIGKDWTWDTSYTYQNTTDELIHSADANPSNEALHFEGTVPHHVVKAHVGYASGRWETDLYGEVASSFDAYSFNNHMYDLIDIDGYETLSGRVAYTFDHDITLALMGSDLLQARTANNYGLEDDRQLYLKLSKNF